MVCAGVRADYKTPLNVVHGRLNAVAYRDTILQPLAGFFFSWHNVVCGCFRKKTQGRMLQDSPLTFYVSNASMSYRGRR